MKTKTDAFKEMYERIDAYNNTVYAIVGFLNTFKYELKTTYPDIQTFQGRKFFLDIEEQYCVTPDLGLTLDNNAGLIGEVKYSFPQDKSKWKDDFVQLKKYDRILSGWTTKNGKITQYDVVLLVQQTRSRAVKDYYLSDLKSEERLTSPFALIEFNKSSQAKEFFHFRIEHGKISNDKIHERLYNGLSVPMDVFVKLYSKIKIYDAEPPLPLLLNYIYECVVDQFCMSGNFKKLTKNSKKSAYFTLQEMTAKLSQVYSFKSLASSQHLKNQPEFPKQDWVRKALDHLELIGEGSWARKSGGGFNYILSRKENNVLDHYIKSCVGNYAHQGSFLF